MNTTIYYFTGTGNSLKIAYDLHKKILPSKLIPIVKVLKKGKIKCLTEKAGFVFPVYILGLPNIIHNFFDNLDISETKYIFTAITSGGGNINAIQQGIAKLNNKGKNLNAGFLYKNGFK